MSKYGTADCIDCGEHTDRRLPERFPHICTTCLFPPRDENGAPLPEEITPRTWSEMLDELHRAVVQQRGRFFRPFGRNPKRDGGESDSW